MPLVRMKRSLGGYLVCVNQMLDIMPAYLNFRRFEKRYEDSLLLKVPLKKGTFVCILRRIHRMLSSEISYRKFIVFFSSRIVQVPLRFFITLDRYKRETDLK
jgi:hypothetical protein